MHNEFLTIPDWSDPLTAIPAETRQNALVVGASQGIGLGFVQQLLKDDRFEVVYGTYRRPELAQELLALAEQCPQLTCLPVDVTEEETIAAAIAQIQARTPQLHRAVYCVGLLHDRSPGRHAGRDRGLRSPTPRSQQRLSTWPA